MSYSNYPAGAANDPNAPYNEVEQVSLEFDILATSTLTRTDTIVSNEYEGGFTDEEGYREKAIFTGDCEREWTEQHYTVAELLEDYKKMLKFKIKADEVFLEELRKITKKEGGMVNYLIHRINEMKYKLKEVEAWLEDDEELAVEEA